MFTRLRVLSASMMSKALSALTSKRVCNSLRKSSFFSSAFFRFRRSESTPHEIDHGGDGAS
ncbi:Hypothetical protein FKW44_011526 [Caligus rogercresseyi]|uniref:Uncharacterized protein n=1 Tax=Caligus rogercresseyi TaxID=217165 RepID=A0A7T8GU25_CALRO|nr:Hypothetical protein FKW44_017772 [Caligus rogercresseyi]QQP50508.1 Hypothetical protein FKW44_011526 [Caligus rogercresseyi]